MRKRSPIWLLPSDQFKELVKNSNSISEIIRHFGFINLSGYHSIVKKRCVEENIDYSHIPLGRGSNKGKKFPDKAQPLKEVMIRNSTYDTGNLKKRLIKNGILKEKCNNCGLLPCWDNKRLVMVLDHINGIHNDNRLENLRLLCPNCNSQQKTFAGRNNNKKKRYNCKNCGKLITKYSKSKMCNNCSKRKVINRPSKEQLLKEIEETNYCAVGRKYGVSDNTIRKWLK